MPIELGLGRIILQKLGYRLVEILLILFLVAAWIHRFGRSASPDKLLSRWVIHVEYEGPDIDSRALGTSHPASPSTAHTVCVPLLLLLHRDLIGDMKVGFVAVSHGQALG